MIYPGMAIRTIKQRGKAMIQSLTKRVGMASVFGMRSVYDGYNLGGLTIAQLRQITEALRAGEWSQQFMALAERMEETDGHYRSVLQQRRLATTGLPRQIIAAGGEEPSAAQLRDAALAERIIQSARFDDLLHDLLDGLSKGFAVSEVVWARAADGLLMPAQYHRIDQRWIYWGVDGETPYIINDRSTGAQTIADPLQWAKFIVHVPRTKSGLPVRGGLALPCSFLWLLKSLGVRDWWAFADVYGLPLRVGKYGHDASEADQQALQQAVAQTAATFGVVIPENMTIEFPQIRPPSAGSDLLFTGMVRFCDREMSKAVVGQTMTTDDGASLSQAQVHLEVRQDLIADDARQLATTISEQLIRFAIDLNYGVPADGAYPLLDIGKRDSVEMSKFAYGVSTLAASGVRIGQKWIRDQFGIPHPSEDEDVIGNMAMSMSGDGGDGTQQQQASQLALAAATGNGGWARITDDLAAPLAEALAEAEPDASADDVFALAMAAGASEQMADDLALQCFNARVDGELERPRSTARLLAELPENDDD